MNDDPIMLTAPGRLRDIELAAMRAYRAKYPDGPPWLELAITTRGAWIDHVDAADPSPAGRTSKG